MNPFHRALQKSKMPVLAANALLEGHAAGEIADAKNPFAKIRPYILKEVAGIRIAIVGVTTPGMPFWFRPEFIHGFGTAYPVEPVRRAIKRAKSEGANAIVVAGHMGLKARTGGDDFANNVMSLTAEFPDAAVFIAGHTHQAIPSRMTNGVLFTQSDHYGIHAGRIDLVFDRNSKKLLKRQARCELMDARFRLDRVVLSRSKELLAQSDAALAHPVGELAETFHVRIHPGETSDIERLIGRAIIESLRERGVPVAGAMHGLFDDKNDLAAGPKTVRDIWEVLPYENYLVTAELTRDEIQLVMEETYSAHEARGLIGFNFQTEGVGNLRRIKSITRDDGIPLEPGKKYPIAFNTFDSRSAGHRFMKLRALLETPATNCQFHEVQTRDTLIDYFERHKVIHRQDLIEQPAKAA
jgi:2',3'-cyclic-nucleotide 2'-phosphodiesterase/3'-nucleotidase